MRSTSHHRSQPVRGRRPRAVVVAAAAASLALIAGCSNDKASPGPSTPVDLDGVELVAALSPFDQCDEFLDHVKTTALDRVGPYGLDGNGAIMYATDDMVSSRETRAPMAGSAAGGDDAAPTQASEPAPATTTADMGAADGDVGTGTNNQEAGVDEADLIKTDGTRIVTVHGNKVVVASLPDGAPIISATIDLGDFYADKLFLLADRAYVLGSTTLDTGSTPFSGGEDVARSSMPMNTGAAEIVEVALGDSPAITDRRVIEGSIVDGRLANGTVRLVMTTPGGSGLGFVYPSGGGSRSEDLAAETNRTVVEESTLGDWLPEIIGADGQRSELLACDHLYRPAEDSGFSMLSILTISDGLGSLTGSGVLADGQITYASTDQLYVATNQWATVNAEGESVSDEHTDVHAFSIAGTEPAAYEASGRVDGSVLNQYSMSEADGNLRIATTTNPQFGGGVIEPMPMPMPVPIGECPPGASCATPPVGVSSDIAAEQVGDSQIVVLGRNGQRLVPLGMVDGLGAGEQIKSVRYVGDIAYVVTFRQTDPFYVIDLSDPSAPKKLGELKVPGFSSYLHPVGDKLVMGIGSDATDEGRIAGAKVSLYDTSDPTNPREVTSWTSSTMGFMVDSDPHAFSWDQATQTAYLPYYPGCFDSFDCSMNNTNGVLVLKVADGAITEIGRITHEDRTPSATPTVPDTTVPETTVPDTTVPETTVPSTTAPDTTVPATTIPETTVPETTVPATVAAREAGGASDVATSTGAIEPTIGPAPIPVDPGVCAAGGCDPGMPYPGTPYPDYQPTIIRVFVLGDRVITLSDAGIAAHTVDGLRLTGFAAFSS